MRISARTALRKNNCRFDPFTLRLLLNFHQKLFVHQAIEDQEGVRRVAAIREPPSEMDFAIAA